MPSDSYMRLSEPWKPRAVREQIGGNICCSCHVYIAEIVCSTTRHVQNVRRRGIPPHSDDNPEGRSRLEMDGVWGLGTSEAPLFMDLPVRLGVRLQLQRYFNKYSV